MNEEKALKEFLLDIDCLDELNPWIDNFNIFDVLKISRTEIRHSNMLAWLLNPKENHGLGDLFIRKLIANIVKNEICESINPIELMSENFLNLQVIREFNHVDLLCVSENFVLVIENKIDSSEHDNQLTRYKNLIKRKYKSRKQIFLYLTPDGILPNDDDDWAVLSYADVLRALEQTFKLKENEIENGIKYLIQDYINILRGKIVEDKKLIEICRNIYKQHKVALDLIFENKGNYIVEKIEKMLRQNEFEIKNSNKRSITFHSEKMNQILPRLGSKNSSWGDEYIYTYWLELNNNEIRGIIELGGWGVNERTRKIQEKIYTDSNFKCNQNHDYKYKRVYSTKKFEINSDDEQDIEAVLNEIIEELRTQEEKIINLIGNK